MKSQKEFGSDKVTKRFFNFFNSQFALLEKLYQHQFTNLKHLDDARLGELYPLLFSIWHTGTSISLLAMHLHVSECYILARALLEKIINYTYLLSCDEQEYLLYVEYTKQKAYRVLDRSFTSGETKVHLRWSGSINLEEYPELKKTVDQFTSARGKPKTRWTSKNLSAMVESISNKGGLEIGYLMFAILWIYDDASEALHGTLYGSTFHVGTFQGKLPSSKEELKRTWNEQFSALFLTLGTCVHTLIQSFNNVVAIVDIVGCSKDNLNRISGVLKQLGERGLSWESFMSHGGVEPKN